MGVVHRLLSAVAVAGAGSDAAAAAVVVVVVAGGGVVEATGGCGDDEVHKSSGPSKGSALNSSVLILVDCV